MNLADMIKGEINRMCVTKEVKELEHMHSCAKKNLDILIQLCDEKIQEQGDKQ